VPDRIVAGTWAVAAAITQGSVTVTNSFPEHLEIALDKLATAGADVEVRPGSFTVR
jgi:UDP-N-acetylglucosamine 1-carboxyvinyltransferase